MTSREPSLPSIDTTTAHPARRYNHWLGGKDNFAADRESADAIEAIFPGIRTAAVENRRFLHRAVRYLVQDAGVRQFLDIGTGLPTADNTHEVAQRLAPQSKVVYVDNDPLVLAHARALLTSDPRGATAYLDADLREPGKILADSALTDTLDLTRPVGLLLVAILHFLPDTRQAYGIVRTLMDALPAGSFLVISHATGDLLDPDTARSLDTGDFPGRGDFTGRTHAQISRFLDGLDPVPPGLTVISDWKPDPDTTPPQPQDVSVYGAVAHKR
jgi:SAM-dependent methyltransferase